MPNRRAFVAAPLIGTIIFLIAVVYSVNLTKTEAQAVGQISDDAYHNREVSLLSIYKSDLSGMLIDGVRQNVENYLTAVDWQQTNDVDYFTAESRKLRCENYKNTIHNQLTALGSGDSYLSGLSQLLNALRSEYNFEGITFEPVKFAAFTPSFGGQQVTWNFNCNAEPGHAICAKMLAGVNFDCENYANNLASPYQCCPAGEETCAPADAERGCEEGTFKVTVNLADEDVYKAMPRVQAKDSNGNVIRASALGDKAYELTVGYPLFKYNDASYRLFAFEQYYPSAGSQMAAATASPATASSLPAKPAFDPAKYEDALIAACQSFKNGGPLGDKFSKIGFKITITNPALRETIAINCTEGAIKVTDTAGVQKPTGKITQLLTPSNNIRITRIDQVVSVDSMRIIDYDPRFRVLENSPNQLTVNHKMQYA